MIQVKRYLECEAVLTNVKGGGEESGKIVIVVQNGVFRALGFEIGAFLVCLLVSLF